jgi:hypothetical protein
VTLALQLHGNTFQLESNDIDLDIDDSSGGDSRSGGGGGGGGGGDGGGSGGSGVVSGRRGVRAACTTVSGALFNHSCAPNAERRFDVSSGLLRFLPLFSSNADDRSDCVIDAGELLCISYLSKRQLRTLDAAQRRALLQRDFGFLCRCQRCESESDS